MSQLHPQAARLLDRMASASYPPYHEVPPVVARRLYRDSGVALQPDPPAVDATRLLLAPSPAGPVPVRAYRPANVAPEASLPALVFFHGGGWVIGDLDTHDVMCRTLANEARCAVLSVEYRRAPEAVFPAAVNDCFAALKFIAGNAASLQIDAARLAVGGDSAGGNLAAVIALLARDGGGPELRFQLLIYPATDQRMGHASIERNGAGYGLTEKVMLYFRSHYLPDSSAYTDWRASPLLAASHANLPPALVLTAGYDPLLDEGRAYAAQMERAGVKTEYRNYPDLMHGFITMGRVLDMANVALTECARVLRAAFS